MNMPSSRTNNRADEAPETHPSTVPSLVRSFRSVPEDTTSLFLGLPVELLRTIAECLEGDNASLAAMMRSCNQLTQIAEDSLYRTIKISQDRTEQVAYLIRTIFEHPHRAAKISSLSVSFSTYVEVNGRPFQSSLGTRCLRDGAEWAASMQAHLERLGAEDVNDWIPQILRGHTSSISAVLLTLLTNVVDLQLTTYDNATQCIADMVPIGSMFSVDFETFCEGLGASLRRSLERVQRFSILGGSLDLRHLVSHPIQSLEIDLMA